MIDSTILIRALLAANLLTELQTVVIGFIDTLPMIKKLLPGRKS